MESTNTQLVTESEVFEGEILNINGTEDAVGSVSIENIDHTSTHDIFGDGSAVATYNLDGDATDLGGDYDGTPTDVTYGIGKNGQAFIGTNEARRVLTFSDNSHLNLNQYTMSCWVMAQSPTVGSYVAITGGTYWDSSRRRLSVGIGYDGEESMYKVSVDNGSFSGGIYHAPMLHYLPNYIPGTWVNVTVFVDLLGNKMKFYVNGVFIDEVTSSYITTTGTNTQIGNESLVTYPTSANIALDQVRIFNRALTTQEVQTLYNEQVTKYTADITSFGLTNPPSVVTRKGILDLEIVGSATTSAVSVVSEKAGLIKPTEYVGIDNIPTIVTAVNETDLNVDYTSTHDIFGDGSAVATYNLDGDATDLGGNYDGTATNVTYEEGKFGQAAVFNGSSSKLNLIHQFIANFRTAVSVSFWVKLSSFSATTQYIFNQGRLDVGGGYYAFGVNASGYVNFVAGDQSASRLFITDTDTFPLNTFAKLTFTQEASGLVNVYFNERLVGSGTIPTGTLDSGNTGFAHLVYSNSGWCVCEIDQVRIFNRTLTEEEVTTLYSEGLTKFQYDITYAEQVRVPSKISILDRSSYVDSKSDEYDESNDKFVKTYNSIIDQGRSFKYKIEADAGVNVKKLTIPMSKLI